MPPVPTRPPTAPTSRFVFLVPLAVVAALAALVSLAPSGPDGEALAATTVPAAPVAAAGRATPTRHVVVRPVTRAGRPAPGWTVRRLRGEVTCAGEAPSARNAGISACFPTVHGLRACWRSQRRTVLCLRDVRSRSLVRATYTGRYPAVRPRRTPSPIAVTLGTGARCLVRFGGAWGAPPSHPRWVGFYTCTGEGSVFGPADSRDGLERGRTWRVRLWRERPDDVVRREVRTATYVGTAP